MDWIFVNIITKCLNLTWKPIKNDLNNTPPEERENLKDSIKAKYNKTAHILIGEKAQSYINDMKIAQKFC